MSTKAGELVTRQEAAKIRDCDIRTIDYHRSTGRIRSVKKGHRTLLMREDVERLGKGEGLPRKVKHHDAIEKGIDVEFSGKVSQLAARVDLLEGIAGTVHRSHGLNEIHLISLQEQAARVNLHVSELGSSDRERWKNAILQMDEATVSRCLSKPNLKSLPAYMIRLGWRMSQVTKTRKERIEILKATRELRFLLSSFGPPGPIVQCEFPIPDMVSPIDALVIASHAVNV